MTKLIQPSNSEFERTRDQWVVVHLPTGRKFGNAPVSNSSPLVDCGDYDLAALEEMGCKLSKEWMASESKKS